MRDDVVGLLSALVAADSVNPSLVPGGAGEAEAAGVVVGEAEAAGVVVAWARAAGLGVDVLEATPGRPSGVVRAPGRGGGRTLMLCGHLDTVGVAGMAAPHEPRVDGDRLYGRGAYDMKGGMTAALLACRELAGAGLAGDVVVAAVADEEHASLGVQEVLRGVRADAAVVTEPTEGEVAVAHKGFMWVEVGVPGRAAHGSRPHLGEDAIVKAGPLLTAIGALDTALAARTHPLLGRGSVHASLIAGGTELSSYPERCTIALERRTLPGESAADVEAEIAALLPPGATQRTLLVREPFEVAPEAGVVRALLAASGARDVSGVSYWADAAFIAGAGIPTALHGPSGAGAHATEEWVSLQSVATVRATLVAAGRELCA